MAIALRAKAPSLIFCLTTGVACGAMALSAPDAWLTDSFCAAAIACGVQAVRVLRDEA